MSLAPCAARALHAKFKYLGSAVVPDSHSSATSASDAPVRYQRREVNDHSRVIPRELEDLVRSIRVGHGFLESPQRARNGKRAVDRSLSRAVMRPPGREASPPD